jgi:hypothetical protein
VDRNAEINANLLRDALLNQAATLHVLVFTKDPEHTKLRAIADVPQPYMKFVTTSYKAVDSVIAEMKTQFRVVNKEEDLFQQNYRTITEPKPLGMIVSIKALVRKRRAFMTTLTTEEEQQNENQNNDEENPKFISDLDHLRDELFTQEFALAVHIS